MFRKFRYWLYRLQFNHPVLFNHKPIHLDLELSRACNLKCSYCYRQSPDYKLPDGFMPFNMALNKLDEYYRKGYRSVKFNWRGEPLLHYALGKLAGYAKHLGYLDVMINTNLATAKLSEDFISNLDSFTEIRVSLDTMRPGLFNEMRVPGDLYTVLENLTTLIKAHNPEKTRLIIQRRISDRTESDGEFIGVLNSYFMQDIDFLRETNFTKEERKIVNWKSFVKVISKPIQPRVTVAFKYSNGTQIDAEEKTSYFDQWQAGLIERQYCKQPSQRTVVGVDGKEWTCCLAYNEPGELAESNRKNLIYWLRASGQNEKDYMDTWLKAGCVPEVCYRCTSFTAYKKPGG